MTQFWESGFFANLFTKAQWKISVDESGIVINENKFLWIEINSSKLHSGLFWHRIKFNSTIGIIELKGIPKPLARELDIILSELGGFIAAKNLLNDFLKRDIYFRRNDVRKILQLITGTSYFGENSLQRGRLIFNTNVLGSTEFKIGTELKLFKALIENLFEALYPIQKIINNNFDQIEIWNLKFIESEKTKFITFFETVESTPLTSEQALAAIVMEDRNLVVAAAGSGKTSALVAKIGYLVKKGYVRPEEILVLSFNSAVKKEIESRVNLRLGMDEGGFASPSIDTFHGLGNKIIKKSKLDKRLAAWVSTDAALNSIINDILDEEISKDFDLAEIVAQFISLYQGKPEVEIELLFKQTNTATILELTKHQFNSVSNNFITLHKTLSKNIVRSYQEMRLANWLSLYGIEFRYEESFGEKISWIGGYRPDFYYPNTDCWHEHFGLNKFGKAPEAWAIKGRKSYEEITQEKRMLLASSEVNWFETTSAYFDNNTWDTKLRECLERLGEHPEFIGWEKYNTLLEASDGMESLTKLLMTSIKHFKNNQLTIHEIRKKVEPIDDKSRYIKFIDIFERVYSNYQKRLNDRAEIDFEDMLIDASNELESGNYEHNYKIILIDEFQDISNARARIIQAMLKQSEEIRLFAVGDDWQSIYKFAGADISVMTNFSEKFGHTKTVQLTNTFRCNQGIADLATEFILKNPTQIKKTVNAKNKSKNKAVRIIFHSGKVDSAIFVQLTALHQWADKKDTIIDVCLLGRYRFLEPENFTALADKFKNRINLFFSTIHGVKGLGFDAVIILGMTDKSGSDFPSSKQDDPALSLFMPEPEPFMFAEERRLFYVALTRAKKLVFLITPKHEGSLFVDELLRTNQKDVIFSVEISDSQEYEIPEPLIAVAQKICPKCRMGRLLPRISKYGPWMVCENKIKNICDFQKSGHG
jgi:DNA helicase-4